MHPFPPPPTLARSPSSPSSAWSSAPSLQTPPMDVQHDTIIGVKSDPSVLSEDDIQFFLKNRGRMYDRFQSSPPRVSPVSQDSAATDDFSWEASHSAIIDPTEIADPSRCSLLIHEVSLLVGLAPDEDGYPSREDTCILVPDRSNHVVLPLSLTPTKSLAPRKHTNTRACHTDTNVQGHPSNIPIFPLPGTTLHNNAPPPRSIDHVIPPTRHKSVDPSPRRRHGQVFQLEPPVRAVPHRNAIHLDETFSHPRYPPPKPTLNSPANRCSSLDRLERSLMKLEAHAPQNHRKSRSEEHSPRLVAHKRDKRPPRLPPPPPKKEWSNHEIMHRNTTRLAHGIHLSDSPSLVPRPILVHQDVAPVTTSPAVSPDGDLTPSSFMDMDIPCAEEILQKQPATFLRSTSKQRLKGLVRAAKRASQGVIAWGKELTGSTKVPSARNSRV